MDRVKDKVAIVTGGAYGIGQAICRVLAQEGAAVAVTDIQDAAGKKLTEEINAAGGKATFWHLDTTKEDEVTRVFNEVTRAFGKLDVLVNNAGIAGVNKPTHEISVEEWDKVIDVNVKGVFLCTKQAIPAMQKNGGGSIINLSSIYGLVGATDLPPYHASKGAVRLMSKTDALFYFFRRRTQMYDGN